MGEESIRIDGVGNLMPAVQSLAEKHKAGARAMLSCIETITAKYIRIQDDPIWERIDGYIDEHIHDRITVENISAEIFISPSTIYHRTKQNTGLSLSNYVARRKMIKASEYFYLTDYKINYISTLLGIDDYNYFSRLFRRIFGMSPTQYRSANIHRLGLDGLVAQLLQPFHIPGPGGRVCLFPFPNIPKNCSRRYFE